MTWHISEIQNSSNTIDKEEIKSVGRLFYYMWSNTVLARLW